MPFLSGRNQTIGGLYEKMVEKKIAYQLLIKVIAVIALVIVIVGLSVVVFMRTTIEKEVNDRLNSETKHVKSELSALFQSAETYANQLALKQNIIGYLSHVDTQEKIQSHPNYESVLRDLLSINKNKSNGYLA